MVLEQPTPPGESSHISIVLEKHGLAVLLEIAPVQAVLHGAERGLVKTAAGLPVEHRETAQDRVVGAPSNGAQAGSGTSLDVRLRVFKGAIGESYEYHESTSRLVRMIRAEGKAAMSSGAKAAPGRPRMTCAKRQPVPLRLRYSRVAFVLSLTSKPCRSSCQSSLVNFSAVELLYLPFNALIQASQSAARFVASFSIL